MIQLASNALITVEEYLAFEGKSKSDTDVNNDKYTLHINGASQAIENAVKRVICPVTSVTELFTGDGTDDYFVRHRRINAEPSLYYWGGTDWVAITSANYPWAYENGRVYFTQGAVFVMRERYRIVYSTGYAQASVPADIKGVCYTAAHRSIKRAEGKEGITSESFGDQTTSWDLSALPKDQRDILQNYKAVRY